MALRVSQWRSPYTLTALARVPTAEVPALRARLAASRPGLRIDELRMVHFLRVFVADADRDLRGRELPAFLVVSAVFDGSTEEFLRAWVALAGATLADVLTHCADGPSCEEEVMPFLLKHAVRPNTFHIGTLGSSMEQIREEHCLARELRAFVDANAGDAVSAEEVRRRALEFVRSRPELPQQPRPPRTVGSWAGQGAEFARTVGIVFAVPLSLALAYTVARRGGRSTFAGSLLASSALVAGVAAGLVRYLELTEPDVVVRQDDTAVSLLEDDEDFIVQNQFTMLSRVRDSVARRLLLRGTLFLSDQFSKHFSSAGRLVGVETIHFARIHQIDQGRRFLFMSDFDGGWNRYLFDFLTTGAFAVVPNWTNLNGCPKTKLLLVPGEGFTQRFLPFTRAEQIRTDVWYSAIPDLTVTDVLTHAHIRRGLFAEDSNAAEWVRRL